MSLYAYVENEPSGMIDQLGLYGSIPGFAIHQYINRRALGKKLSEDELYLLNAATVDVDKDQQHQYMHAMRNKGERCQETIDLAEDFVRQNIDLAIELESLGLHGEALYAFGTALHTVQDATSRKHSNFQGWEEGF